MTVRSVEIGRPESGRDDAVDVGLGEGLGEGRGQGSKNLQGEAGGGGAAQNWRRAESLSFSMWGLRYLFLHANRRMGITCTRSICDGWRVRPEIGMGGEKTKT